MRRFRLAAVACLAAAGACPAGSPPDWRPGALRPARHDDTVVGPARRSDRLAGADRYATAAAVSAAAFDQADTVYVATGAGFADALAAGPAAAADAAPLLLVGGGDAADGAVDTLARLGADRLVVLGGPAAISAELEGYLVGGPRPAPALAPPPPGGVWAFAARRADGSPLRWDPCRAVHYTVNPASMPPGGLDDVAAAVARVGEQTGISFVFDGLTDEPLTERRAVRRGDGWAPILVGWVHPGGPIDVDGSVVGRGYWWSAGETIVSGMVALDAGAGLAGGFASADSHGALLLHELGHVVGLAHVDSPAETMYPTLGAGPARPAGWGPGDRNGLWLLGRAQGCLDTPRR